MWAASVRVRRVRMQRIRQRLRKVHRHGLRAAGVRSLCQRAVTRASSNEAKRRWSVRATETLA
jgi:hypothetical protein